MEFTEQDRETLYNYMDVTKSKASFNANGYGKTIRCRVVEFSAMIRGKGQLTQGFVTRFFQQLDYLEPTLFYRH